MPTSEINPSILWLALRYIPGLGPVSIRKLFNQEQAIHKMWEVISLDNEAKEQCLILAEHEYSSLKQASINLLTLDNTDYPDNLKRLEDAVPVLYVIGQLLPQDSKSIGVVGTRSPSHYGRDVTTDLVSQLVAQNYTIVSGMAKGIDAVAHRAAMEQGGRTIAVWGSGLDKVYPPEHRELAKDILKCGAIISQFPLGVEAQNFTFPARNKLIAGLSRGVLITEAQSRSGSMLTAKACQKYHRPVFAVPGSIRHPNAAGPHQLLKEGAHLVVDVADIVEAIGDELVTTPASSASPHNVSAHEQAILALLQAGPHHIDELIRLSLQSSAQAMSAVAMLELKGLIVHSGSQEYRKA